jgi:hypothetical protein
MFNANKAAEGAPLQDSRSLAREKEKRDTNISGNKPGEKDGE